MIACNVLSHLIVEQKKKVQKGGMQMSGLLYKEALAHLEAFFVLARKKQLQNDVHE
jgi:hypothetical protein